jgi:hypothetical protein
VLGDAERLRLLVVGHRDPAGRLIAEALSVSLSAVLSVDFGKRRLYSSPAGRP